MTDNATMKTSSSSSSKAKQASSSTSPFSAAALEGPPSSTARTITTGSMSEPRQQQQQTHKRLMSGLDMIAQAMALGVSDGSPQPAAAAVAAPLVVGATCTVKINANGNDNDNDKRKGPHKKRAKHATSAASTLLSPVTPSASNSDRIMTMTVASLVSPVSEASPRRASPTAVAAAAPFTASRQGSLAKRQDVKATATSVGANKVSSGRRLSLPMRKTVVATAAATATAIQSSNDVSDEDEPPHMSANANAKNTANSMAKLPKLSKSGLPFLQPSDHPDNLTSHPSSPAPPLAFPGILYEMLEMSSNYQLHHVVSWQDSGRSFKVHDTNSFVDNIMARFFKQTKYKSFQRQLNLYGFSRITTLGSPFKGGYSHPRFQRGRLDQLQFISRVNHNNGAARRNTNAAAIPTVVSTDDARLSSSGGITSRSGSPSDSSSECSSAVDASPPVVTAAVTETSAIRQQPTIAAPARSMMPDVRARSGTLPSSDLFMLARQMLAANNNNNNLAHSQQQQQQQQYNDQLSMALAQSSTLDRALQNMSVPGLSQASFAALLLGHNNNNNNNNNAAAGNNGNNDNPGAISSFLSRSLLQKAGAVPHHQEHSNNSAISMSTELARAVATSMRAENADTLVAGVPNNASLHREESAIATALMMSRHSQEQRQGQQQQRRSTLPPSAGYNNQIHGNGDSTATLSAAIKNDDPPRTIQTMSLVEEMVTATPDLALTECKFPSKLHDMLDVAESNPKFASIVSWQRLDGSNQGTPTVASSIDSKSTDVALQWAFKVHDSDRFVQDLLPLFFKQTKYKSFQRQLNLYGFVRLSTGLFKGCYAHEYFIKGNRALSRHMVRQSKSDEPISSRNKSAARRHSLPARQGAIDPPPQPARSAEVVFDQSREQAAAASFNSPPVRTALDNEKEACALLQGLSTLVDQTPSSSSALSLSDQPLMEALLDRCVFVLEQLDPVKYASHIKPSLLLQLTQRNTILRQREQQENTSGKKNSVSSQLLSVWISQCFTHFLVQPTNGITINECFEMLHQSNVPHVDPIAGLQLLVCCETLAQHIQDANYSQGVANNLVASSAIKERQHQLLEDLQRRCLFAVVRNWKAVRQALGELDSSSGQTTQEDQTLSTYLQALSPPVLTELLLQTTSA